MLATVVPIDFVSLILRVAVGFAMIAHGLPKVKGEWGKQAGQWVGSMGIPPAAARLVTALEFVGGVFLVLGFLVPLVAAFFAIQFLSIIAMKATKMAAGFMETGGKPSYEIDFTYLFLSLAIFFIGAGAYSLDAVVGLP